MVRTRIVRRFLPRLGAALAGFMLLIPCVLAQQSGSDAYDIRHGSIPMTPGRAQIEGGLVLTYQSSDDGGVDDELLGSVDLVGMKPMGPGFWTLYVEGSTTPNPNGVATRIPESNGDAASALNGSGQGRLQVSVLHYLLQWRRSALAVGLIDPTGPLDHSDLANDETQQFLNNYFVNNPSIDFPDYALGATLFYKAAATAPDITFLLSSSEGLADNPDRSYSQLADVDADGKGIFTALQMHQQTGPWEYTLGAWLQTADNPHLDGSGSHDDNYGIYAIVEYPYAVWSWSVRAGMANDDVSEVADFVSLVVQWTLPDTIIGFALGRAGASPQLGPNRADSHVAEAYSRFQISKGLHFTPGLQYIEHSNLDRTGTTVESDTFVLSARLVYRF